MEKLREIEKWFSTHILGRKDELSDKENTCLSILPSCLGM
jgi:hypothetical protein